MKTSPKKLFKIFTTFFRIGAFTFGGGYAMIPLIQHEAVEKNGWISDDDILEIVAIAESTPGPIAINSATFVGYRTAGVLGSALATFGVVLPSFVVITLIAMVLKEFGDIQAVQYAFSGIRVGVLALLAKALIGMFKKSPKGWAAYVAMAAAFVITSFTNIHVLFVIAGCAVFGLVTSLLAERRMKK